MAERVYRAGSSYELVLLDRLTPGELGALGELAEDPDLYGVLRPGSPEVGTWKTVDRDTALLILTLREPGPLPAYARREGGPGSERQLGGLVLDGVLEIDAGGGRFVSGAEALQHVGRAGGRRPERHGALATLSLAALRYAAALELDDPRRLSHRLYDYHRIPLGRRWRERFPDAAAVLARLDLGDGRLPPGWSSRLPEGDGWIHFMATGPRAAPPPAPGEVTYKLYLSPRPEDLETAVAVLFEVLPACPVSQLKIGADASGLLRPDKIVLYFAGFETLAETSARLAEQLPDLPAHGVPFTAETARDGLLSWGVDPPASAELAAWHGRRSWRLWLTDRLALALIAARQAPTQTEPPWQFALQRLELEGVDVDRWMPKTALRQEEVS